MHVNFLYRCRGKSSFESISNRFKISWSLHQKDIKNAKKTTALKFFHWKWSIGFSFSFLSFQVLTEAWKWLNEFFMGYCRIKVLYASFQPSSTHIKHDERSGDCRGKKVSIGRQCLLHPFDEKINVDFWLRPSVWKILWRNVNRGHMEALNYISCSP